MWIFIFVLLSAPAAAANIIAIIETPLPRSPFYRPLLFFNRFMMSGYALPNNVAESLLHAITDYRARYPVYTVFIIIAFKKIKNRLSIFKETTICKCKREKHNDKENDIRRIAGTVVTSILEKPA